MARAHLTQFQFDLGGGNTSPDQERARVIRLAKRHAEQGFSMPGVISPEYRVLYFSTWESVANG